MFGSEFLLIRKTEAVSLWNDVMQLSQITFELPDVQDGAAWEAFEARSTDIFDWRALLEKRIGERMVRTVNLPQFLASGATSLANKVRLLVFIMWMMSCPPRVQQVRLACANLICFTTDMGTELGLGDFEATFRSVLPEWIVRPPARLRPDED